MTVALIDIGMGNLRSVENALKRHRIVATRVSDPRGVEDAEVIILPGVGAFPEAMKRLRMSGLDCALTHKVVEHKTPFLGICLGMQLIADHSDEESGADGLGWVSGRWVRLIGGVGFPVPHVGWNQVTLSKSSILFDGLVPNVHFYFDHMYKFEGPQTSVVAEVDYGGELIASAVQQDNIFAVQFHPERSQIAGHTVFGNFLKRCKSVKQV